MESRNIPFTLIGMANQRWAQVASCFGPAHRPSFSPLRVLVAGDHATLRKSLRTVLEMDSRISVVGEAADDCDLVKMAKRLHPDVVLMDLDMHCCDSFEAVAEISRRNLTSAVIGLTIHEDSDERTAAKDAGVSYFLDKGISSKQLIEAVRRAGSSSLAR